MFENTKTREEGYYSDLFREDMTMQVYVFTNSPQKCKRKCVKVFAELKKNFGIHYIIVSSFQQFKNEFKLNTARRLEIKEWMGDSNMKPIITPTLTVKAEFLEDFQDIDEESEEFQILKVNIGPKFNKISSKQFMNYDHLNSCNEIDTNRRRSDYNTTDRWPLPDELFITQK